MSWKRSILFFSLAIVMATLSCRTAWSQATVGTGSIEGTVTDPTGAVVAGAKVTITNQATGQVISTTANSAGSYASGALTPGSYKIRVEAPSFKASETVDTVQIGVVSPGNVKLELGESTSTVEVSGEAIAVNTEQAEVSGTLTADQIENLPVNGRNFLDLAQLEPGVQIQDGSDFDPTKTGFSSISFGGRFGRTARIEVDGVDVSDENVGTTTTNIPASAINEFQIAQSNLDLSNELTSSGAVNVATKSGTNDVHGEAFGLFRDSSQGAALPGGGQYQRNQWGGDVGGPIIKDKLFFFLDGERTLQHAASGLTFAPPFDVFDGSFQSPYRDFEGLARVDWQATKSLHTFFRYNYFQNDLVPSFGTPSFSFFGNKDRTRVFAGGADFNTGSFTHSFRAEYLKFVNNIADAVRGSGTPFADYPVNLFFPSTGFQTGPSPDAPQRTFQSDRQIKYDGSFVHGSHIIRYGAAYNRLQGGGFASFFGIAPQVIDEQVTSASYNSYVPTAGLTCPGGQTGTACPLNYLPDLAYIGNGLGFSTELPAFGFPFGGVGPDNRIGLYVGDSWKAKPTLTFIYGVRYTRDTGRTDSDLNTIQVVNNYLPGFGDPVKQRNADFGPQVGFAWNVKGDGKTVIRGGIGLFYENTIWNNILFDRPSRLESGAFLSYLQACSLGSAGPVPFADGSTQSLPADACTSAIGATLPAGSTTTGSTAAPILDCSGVTTAVCIAEFEGKFQSTAAAHPTGANATYLPAEIASGVQVNGGAGTFAPDFKVPRSVQMNIGFQRELRPGMVLTVDYLRNVDTHYLLSIDENHTGDAAYFNTGAASAAVTRTLTNCGVATVSASITLCPSDPLGAADAAANGYTPRPATITDYATNGLDSPADINGSGQCGGGLPGSYPYACAFGGINPLIGAAPFLEPVGRAVYNAMDVKWQDNVHHPFPGVHYLNFQATYTLSRFQNTGASDANFAAGTAGTSDQDFINFALDNRDPGRFMGDSILDRTHQFNLGGWADLPAGFRLGLISHLWSPLAVTPLTNAAGPGSIFTTDFTGDGTINDPLPIAQTSATCGDMGGSCNYTTYKTGAFGRGLNPSGLNSAIANYNTKIVSGGMITPAGQDVVNAGLMTAAQLVALGGAPQAIPLLPPDPASLAWLRAFDLTVSYHHSFFNERLTITPSVGIFNLFNFVNFDAPLNILSGSLTGSAGSINGTSNDPSSAVYRSDRIGTGSGVFAFGSPRAIEWGMKLNF
jgi:hypothetical protein